MKNLRNKQTNATNKQFQTQTLSDALLTKVAGGQGRPSFHSSLVSFYPPFAGESGGTNEDRDGDVLAHRKPNLRIGMD